MIMVTGGAGFIGSNFIHTWLSQPNAESVLNLDKMTYAGNATFLESLHHDPRYTFFQGDISDRHLVRMLLKKYQPRAIINFAAESHVDRSIFDPEVFIRTNILGTFNLLECSREYWLTLAERIKKDFRFHHVSTDEVYGSLMPDELAFTEMSAYQPNNPYSASKAASDHLVRAWFHTYGFPALTTNCSNNYGPNQLPEKLIPLTIISAINKKPIPVYGDGLQIRDWLYVDDHCSAIRKVLANGILGETYNIGGWNEMTNLDVVLSICEILDELRPRNDGGSYAEQIIFIKDRPGHDRRYAIDANKIQRNLSWAPSETFESGIRKTVEWYLANQIKNN